MNASDASDRQAMHVGYAAGPGSAEQVIDVDLGVEYLADSPPSLVPQDEHVTEWLNDKAANGWRLITVDRGTYYFQRPAQKLRLAREYTINEH